MSKYKFIISPDNERELYFILKIPAKSELSERQARRTIEKIKKQFFKQYTYITKLWTTNADAFNEFGETVAKIVRT